MNYINSEMAGVDYRSGMQDAEERGEERGIKIGEERGIKIGEDRGEERFARLMQILKAENRNDDISRIITDKAYRQELFGTFNL